MRREAAALITGGFERACPVCAHYGRQCMAHGGAGRVLIDTSLPEEAHAWSRPPTCAHNVAWTEGCADCARQVAELAELAVRERLEILIGLSSDGWVSVVDLRRALAGE